MSRIVAVLAVVGLLAVAAGCGGGEPSGGAAGEAGAPSGSGAPSGEDDEPQESSLTPLSEIEVAIYFPAASGNGLVAERHEIFDTAMPGDRIKQIVSDLIAGPRGGDAVGTLPRGLQLRQAYVLEDGTAWLDFPADLVDGTGGGSMHELLTVYSLVDSIVDNVPEVRRVGILVNGRPIDTLNGHLDLRRPLLPDRSLIADGGGR